MVLRMALIVIAAHGVHVVVALLVVPVLAVAQRPVVSHLAVVHGDVILLVSFDELILLHLCDALCLRATCLAKHTSTDAVHGGVGIHWVVAARILVLALAMHTLHVEVTPVEAIGEVVHVVQKVALCAS